MPKIRGVKNLERTSPNLNQIKFKYLNFEGENITQKKTSNTRGKDKTV